MNFSNTFLKNKISLIIISITIMVLSTGVIGNYWVENKIANWDEETRLNVAEIENLVVESFNLEYKEIINLKNEMVYGLLELDNAEFKNIHSKLVDFGDDNIRIAVFEKNNLIYWNERFLERNKLVDTLDIEMGEPYLLESDINSYLSIKDSVSISNQSYVLHIYKIFEKHYVLNDDYFNGVSYSSKLSSLSGTEITINYSPHGKKTKDGRKHSFNIAYDEKVLGVVTFLKPSRQNSVAKIESMIGTIQGITVLIGFILIGLKLFLDLLSGSNRLIKLVFVVIFFVILRYLLIFIQIPKKLFSGKIFSEMVYFSKFGEGLAYSPVELLITLSFVFAITIFLFRYVLDKYKNRKSFNVPRYLYLFIIVIFGTGIYILSLRGIGASIRGFVFDTSLRYFQSTSLEFSFPHFIMHINILLTGLISLIFSSAILLSVIAYSKSNKKDFLSKNVKLFIVVLAISILTFDLIQKNPQLTLFIKYFQLFIVILITYLIVKFDLQKITKTVLFFLAASIFSISSLLFYNTKLEKASLKTTATIISRFDDNWYKSLIRETLLSEFSRAEAINSFSNDETNFNGSAFKIWTKSQLQKEAINSSVNFISLSGKLLGGFGSIYPSLSLDRFIDTNAVIEEIQIFEEPTLNGSQKLIRGIFPVKDEFAFIGYLDVSILSDLNDFGFSSHPEFISTGKLNDKAILKLDKLIILDYRDKELKIVYGNLNPTQKFNQNIVNASFTDANDAWIESEINGSEYLIYIKKTLTKEMERIIAVALRGKELSIGLFDFFKIFFTHSIILSSLVLFYFIFHYRSRIKYTLDLRTKLLLAFLIISLIPLVLTALYFRNLTEEKNEDAIYYKLGKRAFSVENYLNENFNQLSYNDIFRKASEDLNINYSLFRDNQLEFSSQDLLYDVGLFPKLLHPEAYSELIINESQEILINESVDDYEFNSFYYKANFLGDEIIIKVADGFNKIRLPLSGSEVDVFLFGIYSLAVVLIIIFSAFFANQISSPIRKLTSATKSVAAGDLSINLKAEAKGELGELVNGFQYMTKELKRNQTILAEIEREEAWKEMAKQVAHEIKNPLTPMKLSVQQLVTAYNDGSDKFDGFFKRVTTTILNQIETLKNIATEFSNFARMPKLKVESIDCVKVIKQSINLFADENININLEIDTRTNIINGDYEQLKRTIINLIRNSIQANAQTLRMKLIENNDLFELSLQDDGNGISEVDQGKIFEPNFTTKKEGMGLGLSMARRYLRSIGGELSLVKSSADGTLLKLIFPK